MTPIRGLNLKKLFGKLTPYADDIARGVSSYGDDALRLASNYGDEALDYGVDIASAVNRYDDDVARAFNSNNLDVMNITPSTYRDMDFMTGTFPPPYKKPSYAPSAEDQDWLTQDMLSRGELDNVGSLLERVPTTNLSDIKNGDTYNIYELAEEMFSSNPTSRSLYDEAYDMLNPTNDPYEFLKNPAALNWGGAEGAQNLLDVQKYLQSIPEPEFRPGDYTADDDTLHKLYRVLLKRDGTGLPSARSDILSELAYRRFGEPFIKF